MNREFYRMLDRLNVRKLLSILCVITLFTSCSQAGNRGELIDSTQDTTQVQTTLSESMTAEHPTTEPIPEDDVLAGKAWITYAKRCGCPFVGIVHTDLFAYIQKMGEDPYTYFQRMAEANIFWEMNVSYDSIHQYRVHSYMLDFFSDPEKQDIVRRSGVRVSIGFDGHNVVDYLPERVKEYGNRLANLGIPKPFDTV